MNMRTQLRQQQRALAQMQKIGYAGVKAYPDEKNGQLVTIGLPFAPVNVVKTVRRGIYPNGRYYKNKDGIRTSRGASKFIVTTHREVVGYVTGPILNGPAYAYPMTKRMRRRLNRKLGLTRRQLGV